MNANDISRLSYKELQALALRYRVPGNIKKKILIKVLQAVKVGNDGEVDRLLHDLKQTRRRRAKKYNKNESARIGITSTPIHSPDYVMADDFHYPQQSLTQQPPYQWVGAEEEIVSKEDDNKIPHYEEFRQVLLRKIQREFQTYDVNNNQKQEMTIVDLRTTVSNSSSHSFALDVSNYPKSNMIAINETGSHHYPLTDHRSCQYQQNQKDQSKSTHGSILLKKMLQAPVGTNLGELAAPVFGDCRTWSSEQYESDNLLDNSDTLTAESDGNEDNILNNPDCYGVLNNVKDEYFLNEANFMKNIQEMNQQIPGILTEQNNQYRYTYTNIDSRQNYQMWTVTNVVDSVDANCMDINMANSKILHTMYFDNTVNNTDNETVDHRYQITDLYNNNQSLLNANLPIESQYYHANVIPNAQSDVDPHFVPNHSKNIGEIRDYASNSSNMAQDISNNNETFTNNIHYNSEITSHYSYAHEDRQPSTCTSQDIIQTTNEIAVSQDLNICKDSMPDRTQPSIDGTLVPFWPKWTSKRQQEISLENILNLNTVKNIDYSKIDQTSCVYCYTAPIVTQKPALSAHVCSQNIKLVAEQRNHSFSPYWLLYNDTSVGMKMANVQDKNTRCYEEEISEINGNISNSNSNMKESTEESEDSINDVWMNDYSKYPNSLQKDISGCEDMNTEVTDCLFSTISTDTINHKNIAIPVNQSQEDIRY